MSSARKPSGFLQQNYDKAAVVAVLIALLISASMLVVKLNQSQAGVAMTRSELDPVQPIKVERVDSADLDALADNLHKPFQIPTAQRRMLVGELRVSSVPDGFPIPFDADTCPFTGAKQPAVVKASERDTDGDGLPDVWEEKFGFNAFDPSDAAGDADGDGFSNMEEFVAGTNPSDATDTPPPPAKLRLARVQVVPFKLRFLSVSRLTDTDIRYQLNLRTLERTYFARINEEVEGYTVTDYNEKGPDGPVLTLKQGDKEIRLVQGRVVDEQARNAQLVYLVDGKRFRVNIGDDISLQDRSYKVVDIGDDRVVIRDEEAGRDIEINLLSEDERRSLGTGGAAGGTL